MNRSTVITVVVMTMIVFLAGVYVWVQSRDKDNDGFADSVPHDSFERIVAGATYTNIEGEPISLTDYRGQVLVVNSWASWCPFCVRELPDLATVAQEYAEQGVTVLAINRSESAPQVKSYLRTVGNTDGVVIVLDEADAYYKFIGGFSMPETVFYDRAGNVIEHKRGFMSLDEMRTKLEAALVTDAERS